MNFNISMKFTLWKLQLHSKTHFEKYHFLTHDVRPDTAFFLHDFYFGRKLLCKFCSSPRLYIDIFHSCISRPDFTFYHLSHVTNHYLLEACRVLIIRASSTLFRAKSSIESSRVCSITRFLENSSIEHQSSSIEYTIEH